MTYDLDQICANCGHTYGSHLANATYRWKDAMREELVYPRHYCPGSERGMDWDRGPGTVFKPLESLDSGGGA